MANNTKQVITQAYADLIAKKNIDRVTVKDVAEACGITRQTFYYHFQDIIDLVRWMLSTEAGRQIEGNRTYDTWQKGYLAVFRTIESDRQFILNIYHHIPRQYLMDYLYSVTMNLLLDVVREKTRDLGVRVREEDIDFIANFFKYSLVGIVLDWIDHDMEEDAAEIVSRLDAIIHGTIENALSNAAKKRF